MTDGSSEFLKIIKTIPANDRTLNIPSLLYSLWKMQIISMV